MYDSVEELLREILAGEDSHLDLKEVTFKDTGGGTETRFVRGEGKATAELAKDLSCFANTDGGVIVFGVREDGERVGLPSDKIQTLQEFILNVAQRNLEPPLGHLLCFDRMMLPDSTNTPRLCLKVEIRKAVYSVHAPLDRRPYWRVADRCEPMTIEQQARILERRGVMIPWEERPIFRAGPDEIDRDRLARYYEQRYGSPLDQVPVAIERLLKNLRVLAPDEAGSLHPTGLGLLLFAAQPEQHVSGAFVDVAAYEGSVPDAACQRDAKTIRGSVVDQIERTVEYLRASPFVPVAATKDELGRLDAPAYSIRALQEAVVNALIHRDYAIHGAQVRVFLFPDRIEISNPGRLHNTLTVEGLFAGCQPVRRNQMLAGFLRDYQSPITGRSYMEGRGEGFLSMVRECRRVSGREPELALIGDSVRLTIFSAASTRSGEMPADVKA